MSGFKISLKAARINAGMGQSTVAAALGVQRDTISRWENGKTRPKADQLIKLSELYQIPVEYLKV